MSFREAPCNNLSDPRNPCWLRHFLFLYNLKLLYRIGSRCQEVSYNMSVTCFDGPVVISVEYRNKAFPRRNTPDDEIITVPGTVQVRHPDKSASFSWSYYVRLRSR